MIRRGFTLIELLVVVAIIGLLVGIVLPSLAAATRVSKAVACVSQMRQIGIATMMYADEYRGALPRSSHSALAFGQLPWGYALCPYLGYGRLKGPSAAWDSVLNGLYRCPQDKRRDKTYSYGKNVWFELDSSETGEVLAVPNGPTFWRANQVKRPALTIVYGELRTTSSGMADHIMAHFWYFGGEPEVDTKRHGRNSNYAYLDGHAANAVFATTFDRKRKIDYWKPATAR